RDDRGWIDEPGEIVDMTISIVSHDAFAEPEQIRNAEVIPKKSFELCFAEIGITIWVEEASFSGEQAAFSIHFDRPAFHDDARREERQFSETRNPLRDDIIQVEWRVLAAPRIVAPIHDCPRACAGVVTNQ